MRVEPHGMGLMPCWKGAQNAPLPILSGEDTVGEQQTRDQQEDPHLDPELSSLQTHEK